MPGLLAGQERLELLATDCGPPTGWPDPIGGNCTQVGARRLELVWGSCSRADRGRGGGRGRGRALLKEAAPLDRGPSAPVQRGDRSGPGSELSRLLAAALPCARGGEGGEAKSAPNATTGPRAPSSNTKVAA